MSARLTVVLDDETLYREAKVRAAKDGVALKDLIARALADYLHDSPRATPRKPKRLTIEMLDRWWAESEELDRLYPYDGPTNLSDVKHHLYGWPEGGLDAERRRQSPDSK